MNRNRTNEIKHRNIKKQNRGKTKSVSFTFVQLILIAIIIFSGLKIYRWYIDNGKSSDIIEEVKESITVDENNKTIIDFSLLKEKNSDTVAWIKVEATDIDYPVVKVSNNDYYLNHSFDKAVNGAGWIFADYKNTFDGTDKNIIIYGHNRRDGSMFSSLKNILNTEWYNNENNKYVTFITEETSAKYEVFSVYQVENEDYYIKTDFTGNEFNTFLETIKNRSIKNFNVDVNDTDKILTLSTCANDNKYRVVLHAKKISLENSYEGVKNGEE